MVLAQTKEPGVLVYWYCKHTHFNKTGDILLATMLTLDSICYQRFFVNPSPFFVWGICKKGYTSDLLKHVNS